SPFGSVPADPPSAPIRRASPGSLSAIREIENVPGRPLSAGLASVHRIADQIAGEYPSGGRQIDLVLKARPRHHVDAGRAAPVALQQLTIQGLQIGQAGPGTA